MVNVDFLAMLIEAGRRETPAGAQGRGDPAGAQRRGGSPARPRKVKRLEWNSTAKSNAALI